MPVGYFVTVIVIACCTLSLLLPVSRSSSLRFRIGLVLSEQPQFAIYVLVLSTALAFAQGDIDNAAGWAAVGLATITTGGLLWLVVAALRSKRILKAALEDNIGPTQNINRGKRVPIARIIFRPLFPRRRNIERIADVQYGPAGARNTLDIYRRRSHTTDMPVFIHFHGGSFRGGRKNTQAIPLLYRLADAGWLCISANYRLAPDVDFPQHQIDAKKVVAWVRTHGGEYGADPTTVIASGSSAGAHLALFLALTPNDPNFQPEFTEADTSVAAAVGLGGYYGSVGNNGRESSPITYVTSDAAPLFIVHGDHDPLVPVVDVRNAVARLRQASQAPVVYAELPWAQHTLDLFHSIRFELATNAIEDFLDWTRRQ